MWIKHLSSLQFLTYVAFFGVVITAICKFVPGRAPPVRAEAYPDDELGAHDRKTAKYFVAGGLFLVLGSVHMVVKNLPWVAEYLARTGYAGHLVRDLSNTHVMIVGGGTLLATGLCWLALPRIVGRPLASEGLAQCAFWFTAIGLAVFYVALIANGIAMGSLMEHGWTYPAAKAHMGNWYKMPVGMGAGVMGLGYWCFATNVFVTVFQARTVKVPKPQWHLWKFFATGAAALTVGTVQGVIQVAPKNADWLYKAGHAGEWIDPISHAHINLVTGLTMLVAGSLFALVRRAGGGEPSRRLVNACFYSLLARSLAFYAEAPGLYTGKIAQRVGRRGPIALAGYELPLGLMGFPGLGWLFAGFPFTASILLCAGPALAWAVIPIAFSPFGQGPLRDIGWKGGLAWLPASALVSSAALYRAHARRRARLEGRSPRGRRRLTPASYRARVGLAAGARAPPLLGPPVGPAGGGA